MAYMARGTAFSVSVVRSPINRHAVVVRASAKLQCDGWSEGEFSGEALSRSPGTPGTAAAAVLLRGRAVCPWRSHGSRWL